MGLKEPKRSKSGPEGDDAAKPATPATPWHRGGADSGAKVSVSIGLIAAFVLAVMVNILAARHYKRWDVTRGGTFSLSPATVETLRSLGEPIQFIVLLSKGDPREVSISQMLVGYEAETSLLRVRYVDPDRNPAELIAIREKYGLKAEAGEGGVTAADTVAIVTRGEKHHFIAADDLVEVDDTDDSRVKPKLEIALTGAIRSVLEERSARACFTSGHGEHSIEEGGDMGLAYLRERLEKNNYEVVSVMGEPDEKSAPPDPKKGVLDGCDFLVLAGPVSPVPKADADAMKRFIEGGGSALLVVGPVPNEADKDFQDLGVGEVVALAGVTLENDFVFEKDRSSRSSRGFGESFFPKLETHPITANLRRGQGEAMPIQIAVASSLKDRKAGITPVPLLRTSDKAFGLVDFFGWAKNPGEPERGEADHGGPLNIAIAAERPKTSPSAERGARVVVISSASILFGANWRQPEYRGTAMFVEESITWLAARKKFLDIPDKSPEQAGLKLTESALSSISYFVVMFLPGVATAIGVLVFFSRRRTRRATNKRAPKREGDSAKDAKDPKDTKDAKDSKDSKDSKDDGGDTEVKRDTGDDT